jgi:hypothetical protein
MFALVDLDKNFQRVGRCGWISSDQANDIAKFAGVHSGVVDFATTSQLSIREFSPGTEACTPE